MSIVKKIMYQVKCDGCGEIPTENSEIVAWTDPEYPQQEAYDCYDYISHKGNHYCPECTVWDEEKDERVPK